MREIKRVIIKGAGFLREHGFAATCRAAARRLRSHPSAESTGGGKALPYGFAYEAINYRQRSGPPAPPSSRGRINWVIPNFYTQGAGDYSSNRVVFYARHETRRRGAELGLLALALLKKERPDVEVVLYGSEALPYKLPFEFTPAGIPGERELAALYRGATVGLSVSLTNYSLVPQEMLACGLPVVEMGLPPVRAAYPLESPGIRLCAPSPEGIAAALMGVLGLSPLEMRRARKAAAGLVSRLAWAEAERRLLDFVRGGEVDRRALPLRSASQAD